MTLDFSLSVEQAEVFLRESIDSYKNITVKKAKEYRRKEIWAKAEAVAEEGKTDMAQEYQNLLLREKQREAARAIKAVNHRLGRQGVTSVKAPIGPNGEWEETHDKETIEQACLEENARRFQQAQDTPFMVEPLSLQFGKLGIGQRAQQVLNGTYVTPPGSDENAILYLKELKNISIQPLPPEITYEDYL